MARHGFGRGEYRYFAYPLPGVVARLRAAVYPRLAPIANAWAVHLGDDDDDEKSAPPDLESFLAACHAAGQSRPTPLEFVLTEQRPEDAVAGRGGPAAARRSGRLRGERPAGTRAPRRLPRHDAPLRHGVSRIRRGHRVTLGVIFHDAT